MKFTSINGVNWASFDKFINFVFEHSKPWIYLFQMINESNDAKFSREVLYSKGNNKIIPDYI